MIPTAAKLQGKTRQVLMEEHKPQPGHQRHGDSRGHIHHEAVRHDHQAHHARMVADFRRRFWVSLVLTIPVLVLSPMLQEWAGLAQALRFPGSAYVQLGFATAIFLYGGWPFLSGLVRELRRSQPGMMTLIGLAITVAYGYSTIVVFGLTGRKVFFWELATLIDVMLLGHWIEMRSVLGAGRALTELVRLLPDRAHRLRADGSIEEVGLDELKRGDRVLIKPGERLPVDGRVVEGRTTLNQGMLTGETKPVEKGEGDEVVAGAVNGESAVTMEVLKTGEDTYISQVIETVRRAQESRSRTQDLADRAALILTIVAISTGGLTLAAWLLLGRPLDFSLERSVTVMVITCPHALGLAIPLVVAVSTSLAARSGLLVRNRSAFERARKISAVVFDKTGTLTEGRFAVAKVIPFGDCGEDDLLGIAAAVESRSEHSIAKGIVAEAQRRGIGLPEVKEFTAIPGKGAQAKIQGKDVKVVSVRYLAEQGIDLDNDDVRRASEEGDSLAVVLVDGLPAGAIALADVVRAESFEAIARLKEMGVQVMMITGDSQQVADSVARKLGLDDYFAEVLPDKKAEKIRQLRQRGLRVAMAGDGINDAPALVEADVGVAIGAGTDVAVESADIVLVRSDPRDLVSITMLARRSYSKMVQNLLWATGYNVVAIPLAAGVLAGWGVILSPAVGAIIMSLSTIIVAVNARLLGLGEAKGPSS